MNMIIRLLEEGLFVNLSMSIVLHCSMYRALIIKLSIKKIILLRDIIGRYRVMTDMHVCYTVIKISLNFNRIFKIS